MRLNDCKKDKVQEITRWVAETYLSAKHMCPQLGHSEIIKIVSEIYIECKNEELAQTLSRSIEQDHVNNLLNFVSIIVLAECKVTELSPEYYHKIREGLFNAGVEDTVIV
jgi:hypothetical protein